MILYLVMLLFVSAVHAIVVSSIRLRLPYVDPFLTIFAAIAIVAILAKVGKGRIEAVDRFLEGSH